MKVTKELLESYNSCQVAEFESLFPNGADTESADDIRTCVENGIDVVNFAYTVIKGRWPEAEPYILTHPMFAVDYALNVIHGPWLEAEEIIKTSQIATAKYTQYYQFTGDTE